MKKIIVSLSGGIDSAVTLALALKSKRYGCHTVSFDYGSKHNRYENFATALIAMYYNVPLKLISLAEIMKDFKSNLMLSGGEIPEGHYENENMSKTVVPARNIIFISILAGLAQSIGAEEVWLGIHGGDHAIYPDCTPDFYYAMRRALQLGTGRKVGLVAPFLYNNKAYIVQTGRKLNVPFELTRTCYKEQKLACGKCGSCVERLEAFSKNAMTDPIEYEVQNE